MSRADWSANRQSIQMKSTRTKEEKKKALEKSSAFFWFDCLDTHQPSHICQNRTHTSLHFIRNQISHEKILLLMHFSNCGNACVYISTVWGRFISLCRSRLTVMKYRIDGDKHVVTHWKMLEFFFFIFIFSCKRITASDTNPKVKSFSQFYSHTKVIAVDER